MNDQTKLKAANLYALLGVTREATDEEIKNAYYTLAKTHHPDQRGYTAEATEAFNAIMRAAEILRDPEKRKLYDLGRIDETGNLTPSAKKQAGRAKEYRAFAFAFFVAFFVTTALGLFMVKENEEREAAKTHAPIRGQIMEMADHQDEPRSSITPAAPKVAENLAPSLSGEPTNPALSQQVPPRQQPSPGVNRERRNAIAPSHASDDAGMSKPTGPSSISPVTPKVAENLTPSLRSEASKAPLNQQITSTQTQPAKGSGQVQGNAIAPSQPPKSAPIPTAKQEAPKEETKIVVQAQANAGEPMREAANEANKDAGAPLESFPIPQRKPEKLAPFAGEPPEASRAMVQDSFEHWRKKPVSKSTPARMLAVKQRPKSLLKALVETASCIYPANLDNWPRKCPLTAACRANKAWCSC